MNQMFQFDQWKTSTGLRVRVFSYDPETSTYTATVEEDHVGKCVILKDEFVTFNWDGISDREDVGKLVKARTKQERW